jgi:hypothetical protein
MGTMTLRVVSDEAEMVALNVPISRRFTTSSDDPNRFNTKPGDVV